MYPIQLAQTDDLNDKNATGLYWWASALAVPQNAPVSSGGSCLSFNAGTTHYIQVCVDGYYGSGDVYIRIGYVGQGWKAWKKITLTSLT